MPDPPEPRVFADRAQAGRLLGEQLRPLVSGPDVTVLGIARGGVRVAFEVAGVLGAPLDVILVNRLGIPWRPEQTMGAVGEAGARFVDHQVIAEAMVGPNDLMLVEQRERGRLQQRVSRLRRDRPARMLGGQTAIIVDDGLVTGSSAHVAGQVARHRGAARIILALPVADPIGLQAVAAVAEEVVTLQEPECSLGIGRWYRDFSQTSDDEVSALLMRAAARTDKPAEANITVDVTTPNAAEVTRARREEIAVSAGRLRLAGALAVPEGAGGLVILVHISCRERHSGRSRFLGDALNDAGLATLDLELLSTREETSTGRFADIEWLATRLSRATRSVRQRFAWVGYLAISAGDVAAAVALHAASMPGADVAAVACLSGNPGRAPRLSAVRAATLLVAPGAEAALVRSYRQALSRLSGPRQLVIIPGASRSFDESGALAAAAAQITAWFRGCGEPSRPARDEGLCRSGSGAGTLGSWNQKG